MMLQVFEAAIAGDQARARFRMIEAGREPPAK